ncbi:hypothetical protein HW555_005011 [Spodoptera exigua]|uniref:Uncharacterized protein n=1 Tax=Spodoptera exigua TaxID=7107 RepID=A0A835GH74_SPOEX|nr:hypothetical protein HW555_005011 [Spodoptera exigua]
MGITNSKEYRKKKVDEATSNTNMPNYHRKACACGNEGTCKKKVTPAGVTIHYPQKKRKFSAFGGKRRYKPPKIKKSKFSNHRPINKLKGQPKKFTTWRLDNIAYKTPFNRSFTRPRPNVCSESDISVTVTFDVTSSSDVTVRSEVVN